MKTILITYQSKTGITKKYGEEIGKFLSEKKVKAKVVSVQDFDQKLLKDIDLILLGCWTAGLMIFLQHPDKVWVKFAKELPDLKDKKVGLFTTYKLATGSMFKKMKKHLPGKMEQIQVELKSKNGSLSEQDKSVLVSLIN